MTRKQTLDMAEKVIDRAKEREECGKPIDSLFLIHDQLLNEFDMANVQIEEIEFNRKTTKI